MKINKIYIASFGGLKNFTLELNDGLNVIYGNNEDGKSTVAAFIKAMFYGTGRSTKNLAESTRQKYTPWDGSAMAGRIFFESNGKKYCLEKEFRKSDSTDRITLTDLDSGKAIDVGDNVGQQFFGLSAAAFERSLFIGNGDFIKDDSAAGEINGKLSNIALCGNEDVSYKKIEKNILDTRNKIISKSGRSGSYNEDLQELANLNARLEKADFDAKTKAALNEKAQDKRAEYEKLYNKYIELKTIIDQEQDYQNREKLSEFLETKRQLDELNQLLTLSNGTIINDSYTQKLDFALSKYERLIERCAQINEDINAINEAIAIQNSATPESAKEQITSLNNEVDNLSQQKNSFEEKDINLNLEIEQIKQNLESAQGKKSAVNPLLLALSVVFAATGGVTAFFTSPIVAAVLIGIAAALLTLSFILKPKNKSAVTQLQNKLAEAQSQLSEIKTGKNLLQEQINNINAKINTLSAVLQSDAAIKQQRIADLNQKKQLLDTEQEKATVAKAELLSLLSGLEVKDNIDAIKERLQELKQKTNVQREIKLQLKTASQFLGNIDYDEAEKKLAAINKENQIENVDFDSVKSKFDSTSEKLSLLKEELTVIATELKASFKNSENPEELKREIALLQEKIDAKKAFCDAADLAVSVLEESFYELRRGYGSELETQTQLIFSALTNGKYNRVTVTDGLEMSVEQTDVFGTRDLNFLSLGATHQAYLSLRLAIAKLISNDEALPLFLDDALSQYDDSRTKKAMDFLKEFCANGQGILFTCHNSICDIANELKISIQRPYN